MRASVGDIKQAGKFQQAKLRHDMHIGGTAWHCRQAEGTADEHPHLSAQFHSSPGTRREVVLGDDAGGLHSFAADERDRRDRAAAPLYALEGRACAPITGLQQHVLAGGRVLVLVATATRLYAFAGEPTLQAVFSAYPESSGAPMPACSVKDLIGAGKTSVSTHA